MLMHGEISKSAINKRLAADIFITASYNK